MFPSLSELQKPITLCLCHCLIVFVSSHALYKGILLFLKNKKKKKNERKKFVCVCECESVWKGCFHHGINNFLIRDELYVISLGVQCITYPHGGSSGQLLPAEASACGWMSAADQHFSEWNKRLKAVFCVFKCTRLNRGRTGGTCLRISSFSLALLMTWRCV